MKLALEIYKCRENLKGVKIIDTTSLINILGKTVNATFSQEAAQDISFMSNIDLSSEIYFLIIENFLTNKVPALAFKEVKND